jgi:uncharacterized protein YprB with RNaseH-like and TPR domain
MMLRRRLRRMKDHWQLRRANSPWVNLFQRYQGVEMVSLDIETTSLDVAQAQILSIGAVIIRIAMSTSMTSTRGVIFRSGLSSQENICLSLLYL